MGLMVKGQPRELGDYHQGHYMLAEEGEAPIEVDIMVLAVLVEEVVEDPGIPVPDIWQYRVL